MAGTKTMTPEERKREQMLTQPVEKLVCTLAVPSIITMLITAIYNSADTYFVGRISTVATASVGLALPLMNIIQAIGFFFGHGSGNFMAKELGRGRVRSAAEIADTAMLCSFSCGLIIALLGELLIGALMKLLGATPALLESSRQYLGFLLLGAPFSAASFTMNNQLRFRGEAQKGTVGMGFGSVLNIVLDPILIFGCNMGVAGAALATSFSQAVSFFLLMYMSGRLKGWKPAFRLTGDAVRTIFRYGTPSLVRQGFTSVASICMNHVGGLYGEAVIAAVSVVQRILMIGVSVLLGLGQGFQPVCGFNHGAGCFDRVRRVLSFCLKLSTAFACVYAAAAFVFAEPLVAFFRDDPAVIAAGVVILRWQSVFFCLLGIIQITSMLLQNLGKTWSATLLGIARQGLFFIPILYTLSAVLGIQGVYMSQALADLLTALVSLPFLIHEMRLLKQ